MLHIPVAPVDAESIRYVADLIFRRYYSMHASHFSLDRSSRMARLAWIKRHLKRPFDLGVQYVDLREMIKKETGVFVAYDKYT